MKKILFVTTSIITFVISFFGVWFIYYHMSLKSTSEKNIIVDFSVEEGNNYYSIADDLKSEGLIRSKFVYELYIRLRRPSSLKAGVYQLNKNMDVKKIVNTLSGDITNDLNSVKITFKEGSNIKSIIKEIVDNTDNSEEDVLNLLEDTKYLEELINKYWFITKDILNEDIYYALEGYLYPNTYTFRKDASVKEMFHAMLEQTLDKLEDYKSLIEKSSYSVHEILTLASIVELEGVNSADRNGIAGVFYNRLNKNWNLGSDVTTYYGAGVNLSDRDLTTAEINDNNAYNTRAVAMAGKLPVGPICNPSVDSIKAVLNPEKSDYFFFVADKNGKTYFTKTESEHNAKKNELIKAGLWYTY